MEFFFKEKTICELLARGDDFDSFIPVAYDLARPPSDRVRLHNLLVDDNH